MSGPTKTIWKALKSVIQMESRIELLTTTAREQQSKIETLTERVIRLEAQMDMLLLRVGATPNKRCRESEKRCQGQFPIIGS